MTPDAISGPDARPMVEELQQTFDVASQLTLPNFGSPPEASPSPATRRATSKRRLVDDDPLARAYFRRLTAQGVANAGFEAYRYQLDSMLRIASRMLGKTSSLQILFQDEELLGRVLTNDEAPIMGGQLSKWTLAQRRSAIRSLGSLMRPELRDVLPRDPLEQINFALRASAERIGTGYRLTGGKPRQRGGYVPAPTEIAMVVEATGKVSGYRGLRNQVFFEILARSGTRVNALRELDGADCFEMPSGRLRLFVHDKGKIEPRELELSLDLSILLQRYVDAFNQFAAGRRWRTQIRIGEPGPIWRNSARGRWPYNAVLETLHEACSNLGITPISPHALRRAFATDATSVLPRHVVALAGGWQGVERLDDHYVHPRQHEIWRKLAGETIDKSPQSVREGGSYAPTSVS